MSALGDCTVPKPRESLVERRLGGAPGGRGGGALVTGEVGLLGIGGGCRAVRLSLAGDAAFPVVSSVGVSGALVGGGGGILGGLAGVSSKGDFASPLSSKSSPSSSSGVCIEA